MSGAGQWKPRAQVPDKLRDLETWAEANLQLMTPERESRLATERSLMVGVERALMLLVHADYWLLMDRLEMDRKRLDIEHWRWYAAIERLRARHALMYDVAVELNSDRPVYGPCGRWQGYTAAQGVDPSVWAWCRCPRPEKTCGQLDRVAKICDREVVSFGELAGVGSFGAGAPSRGGIELFDLFGG